MWLTTAPISDCSSPLRPRRDTLGFKSFRLSLTRLTSSAPLAHPSPRLLCPTTPPVRILLTPTVRLLPLPSVGPIMNRTRPCRRAVALGPRGLMSRRLALTPWGGLRAAS